MSGESSRRGEVMEYSSTSEVVAKLNQASTRLARRLAVFNRVASDVTRRVEAVHAESPVAIS